MRSGVTQVLLFGSLLEVETGLLEGSQCLRDVVVTQQRKSLLPFDYRTDQLASMHFVIYVRVDNQGVIG